MEIRLHSSKKHRVIGYYLKIVRDVIMSPRTPFNRLYYVDLYCGDGGCTIESTGKEYDTPIIQSLLKPAKEKGFPIVCFLNDADKFNSPTKIERMKENTKEYAEFVDSYKDEDANVYYKEVLQKIPKDQFSIFFLDPSHHKDLKWKTIEGISQHQHIYKVNYYGTQIRRPEIIINLMTFSLINSYRAKSYESINRSLGTEKWREEIEKNKELGIPTPVETALVSMLIEGIDLKIRGFKIDDNLMIPIVAAVIMQSINALV